MSIEKVKNDLLKRGIDFTLYRVFPDEDEGVATFLIWNLSGQLVGYQTYRPDADKQAKNHPRDGRYYTFVRDEASGVKFLSVWGLETLTFRDDVLFVLEGTFKAVPFHTRGIPAIATLSNNPKPIRNFLSILSESRRVIVVGDNDGDHTTTRSMGYELMLPPSHVKDVDDLTQEEFDEWLKQIMEI